MEENDVEDEVSEEDTKSPSHPFFFSLPHSVKVVNMISNIPI